ncbi:hypothetical protein M3N64_02280 [Sporolactobacillus sp. CPB3-1]|uniref:Uncharacterized protein n=1 Tax=Sporolactobacillus mangiferae TaxID=2940498 RepID=A0ABT0M7E2_9BACL|nr:hypothetical protein [Sporolactobacillus mangiferae]MCL1630782.1 hypothetical protein [Sporolactobacillus mangiferae]
MPIILKRTVNKVSSVTNHKDLVELAGFQSYKIKEGERYRFIKVNDKKYQIVSIIGPKENKTGLDAMTVQNVDTGEYTVVFQGTQVRGKYGMHDMITDIQLLGSTEPEQVKAARAYFDRMNKKYGVHSVCGNSLGGALANVQENQVCAV